MCTAIHHSTPGSCRLLLSAPEKPDLIQEGDDIRVPQTYYFIHFGKNIVKDPFTSKGEGRIECLFLINNILERSTACGYSLTTQVEVTSCPVSSGGSQLPGRLWGVLESRLRLGKVARACQPRSLWDKCWHCQHSLVILRDLVWCLEAS